MLELLAGLALFQLAAAAPASASVYADDSLSGFVAIANSRPVDGIDYGAGNGVASAGMIYSRPGGLFAGTEFLAARGDGTGMPEGDVLGLQTFAGYAVAMKKHRLAVELLDYRLDASTGRFAHQGIGLRYRRGGLQLELAHERDRPFYYHYQQRFFRYDNDRFAIGWEQAVGRDLSWSLGGGVSRIEDIDLDYRFVTARLGWHAGGADWHAGVSWASDDLEAFYGHGIDRRQLVLRVALPFRIF